MYDEIENHKCFKGQTNSHCNGSNTESVTYEGNKRGRLQSLSTGKVVSDIGKFKMTMKTTKKRLGSGRRQLEKLDKNIFCNERWETL